MVTVNSGAPRKRIVLLVEFNKSTLAAYRDALSDVAMVKPASDTDSANTLVMNEFNNGTILVLGGDQENTVDLLKVLSLAIKQANGNHFSPIIVANTGNNTSNRTLLNAGCTKEIPTKKGLYDFISNYGKSQSPRENRAAAFR